MSERPKEYIQQCVVDVRKALNCGARMKFFDEVGEIGFSNESACAIWKEIAREAYANGRRAALAEASEFILTTGMPGMTDAARRIRNLRPQQEDR